jgi:hypothetical protein
VIAMAGIGGIGLYGLLELAGVATATNLAVVGGGIVALIVRTVIRARVA